MYKRRPYWHILIVTFVFLSIEVLAYLINPFENPWSSYKYVSYGEFAWTYLYCLFVSWGILRAGSFIASFLNKKLPWTSSPLSRFLLQMVLLILTVGLLWGLDLILRFAFGSPTLTQEQSLSVWQFYIASVIVSILVSMVHTGAFMLERWQVSMSEAAELRVKALELKEVAMESELLSLRLQLDPHFMFNNFNTLSELINEDANTASKFLDNLSRVYRYMIQNLKKDLVRLEDEIRFLEAYLYLIRIRHGDNVQVEIDLDKVLMGRSIPPITLQLLVENAIKHNIASKASPLLIRVYQSDPSQVCVRNNLQRIPSTIFSTKLGLQNIKDRYLLLGGVMPVIEESEGHFTVRLPLLDF
ncbi:sensor histidine kinase [Pontibacter sp. 13R65]|uniref:sensor histidine kinase n=1 Tax=Pontibacter sp. 13R65 TaxID=3127458 RepID=UPI00301CD8BB